MTSSPPLAIGDRVRRKRKESPHRQKSDVGEVLEVDVRYGYVLWDTGRKTRVLLSALEKVKP